VNFQSEFGAKFNTVTHSTTKLRDTNTLYEKKQRNYGCDSLLFASYQSTTLNFYRTLLFRAIRTLYFSPASSKQRFGKIQPQNVVWSAKRIKKCLHWKKQSTI